MGREIVGYLFIAIIAALLIIQGSKTAAVITAGGQQLNSLASTLTGQGSSGLTPASVSFA